MISLSKRRGGSKGFILLCFTLAFIVLLTLFTIQNLQPITPVRIADCESRIENLKTRMDEADVDEEKDEIQEQIDKYTNRISMLKSREKCYGIAMMMVMVFFIMGYAYQLASNTCFTAPLAALSVLLAIGISFRTIVSFEIKDIVYLALSMSAAVATYMVLRRMLRMNNVLFGILTVAVLVLLLVNGIFGTEVNGAKNWVYIFGISIQPGEIIKFLLVVMGAYSYQNQKRVFVYYVMSLISCMALLFFGDIGTAMVIFVLALMMTLLLLDNPKVFAAFTLLAVMALLIAFLAFSHVKVRFGNWGNAMENPEGQQAQVIRSIIFGGLGGLGIENSTHILNIYSIDSDVIIGGITAVFGVGMLIITMMCYAILALIPKRNIAVYPWAYYVVTQFSVIITVQPLLNFLGSVDVLPFTGIVAPFLSSGGSASVTFFMLFGIMIAALNPKIEPLKKESETA